MFRSLIANNTPQDWAYALLAAAAFMLVLHFLRRLVLHHLERIDLAPCFPYSLSHVLCGLPVLLLGRCPALLKRHRTDIAQRRVQSLVVVEI